MTTLRSHWLDVLGLERRAFRWWREFALFTALFMDLAWIAPWLASLLERQASLSVPNLLAALVTLALLTFLLVRSAYALELTSDRRQALLLGLLVLVLPVAISSSLYAGEELSWWGALGRLPASISAGETLFPPEFVLSLGVFYLWSRALRWGSSDAVSSEIIGRFKFGFMMLLVYIVAFSLLGRETHDAFVYGFFFFALVAMSSSRLSLAEAHAASGSSFTSVRWMLALAGGLLLFTLFLVLVGQGMVGNFALVRSFVYGLWLLFWGLVILLLSPFIIGLSILYEWLLSQAPDLSWRIEPLETMFNSAQRGVGDIIAGISEWLDAPWLLRLVEWLSLLGAAGFQRVLRPALLWGTLALILAIGLYYAGRRAGFWRALRAAIPQDQSTEADDAWRSLLGRARARLANLRRGLNRLADPQHGRRLLAAARIRRVYTFLLDLSAELGRPRQQAQTPQEFLTVLHELFPHHGKEVEVVSRAYQQVRYGELDETPTDVIEVDRAWLHLRLEGDHLKRVRRAERKRRRNVRSEQ